jgi:hypothetical protein
MYIVWNILRGVEVKGLIPVIMVKVDLIGVSRLHSLELIIKDHMILSSDLAS